MIEPDFPAWDEGEGWRVIDGEGNVLQSGPPVEVEATSGFDELFDQVGE